MIAKNKKIKNESRQTIFFSVLLGALLFTVVGYLVVSNLKINARRTELKAQLIKLETELNALEEKKSQLQAHVSEAADEEYLDKEARETFNLKKPGEEVVTILPSEGGESNQLEESIWDKVLDKIKFW